MALALSLSLSAAACSPSNAILDIVRLVAETICAAELAACANSLKQSSLSLLQAATCHHRLASGLPTSLLPIVPILSLASHLPALVDRVCGRVYRVLRFPPGSGIFHLVESSIPSPIDLSSVRSGRGSSFPELCLPLTRWISCANTRCFSHWLFGNH